MSNLYQIVSIYLLSVIIITLLQTLRMAVFVRTNTPAQDAYTILRTMKVVLVTGLNKTYYPMMGHRLVYYTNIMTGKQLKYYKENYCNTYNDLVNANSNCIDVSGYNVEDFSEQILVELIVPLIIPLIISKIDSVDLYYNLATQISRDLATKNEHGLLDADIHVYIVEYSKQSGLEYDLVAITTAQYITKLNYETLIVMYNECA